MNASPSTLRRIASPLLILAGVVDLIYTHLPVFGWMMIAIGLIIFAYAQWMGD